LFAQGGATTDPFNGLLIGYQSLFLEAAVFSVTDITVAATGRGYGTSLIVRNDNARLLVGDFERNNVYYATRGDPFPFPPNFPLEQTITRAPTAQAFGFSIAGNEDVSLVFISDPNFPDSATSREGRVYGYQYSSGTDTYVDIGIALQAAIPFGFAPEFGSSMVSNSAGTILISSYGCETDAGGFLASCVDIFDTTTPTTPVFLQTIKYEGSASTFQDAIYVTDDESLIMIFDNRVDSNLLYRKNNGTGLYEPFPQTFTFGALVCMSKSGNLIIECAAGDTCQILRYSEGTDQYEFFQSLSSDINVLLEGASNWRCGFSPAENQMYVFPGGDTPATLSNEFKLFIQ
jgi:hypothetical protein